MFFKYPIICSHVYCYSNKSLPPPQGDTNIEVVDHWWNLGCTYNKGKLHYMHATLNTTNDIGYKFSWLQVLHMWWVEKQLKSQHMWLARTESYGICSWCGSKTHHYIEVVPNMQFSSGSWLNILLNVLPIHWKTLIWMNIGSSFRSTQPKLQVLIMRMF